MAENGGSTPGAVLTFVERVCGILPNITPDLLEKLIDYLKSAGVHSEADIGKVDEHQLAIVLGHENATKLLDYFKKQEPVKVEPPSTPAANSSLSVASSQPMTIGCNRGDGHESAVDISWHVAQPQPTAIGWSSGRGREITVDILQMVMMMQRMESDKNREMLMLMQRSQEKTLNAFTTAMSQMTTMHKDTLEKMSEQMTQQSKMHQETIKVMNEQMQTATKMQWETLQAVQRDMTATQRMNAETLAQVTKSMTTTLGAQAKNMQEYRLHLARQNHGGCAIM